MIDFEHSFVVPCIVLVRSSFYIDWSIYSLSTSAFTWRNDDPVLWRIYTPHNLGEFQCNNLFNYESYHICINTLYVQYYEGIPHI